MSKELEKNSNPDTAKDAAIGVDLRVSPQELIAIWRVICTRNNPNNMAKNELLKNLRTAEEMLATLYRKMVEEQISFLNGCLVSMLVEFGYRQCEKGENLQAAIKNAMKLLVGETTINLTEGE